MSRPLSYQKQNVLRKIRLHRAIPVSMFSKFGIEPRTFESLKKDGLVLTFPVNEPGDVGSQILCWLAIETDAGKAVALA
jgi:hypothetical protein